MTGISKTVASLDGDIVTNGTNPVTGMRQIVVRFGNGYGASIIGGGALVESIGFDACEGAVLKFRSDGDYELVYDTGVTDDVERFGNVNELVTFLRDVAGLTGGEPVAIDV